MSLGLNAFGVATVTLHGRAQRSLDHIIAAVRQHLYQEESSWFTKLIESQDVDQAVIQASADWSAQHLEQAPETVATVLLQPLASELGIPLPPLVYVHAHRWRFARSGRSGEPTALWDASIRLGACGDWLAAPRVEAAWLSGRRAAALIGEAV